MMTIPMENSKENSSIERAQRLLNKNDELKKKLKKAAQVRVPSDPNIWQQMRENYEAIVLENHALSEQHEVELSIWQLHYKKIEDLRTVFTAAVTSGGPAASQSGKGPTRSGVDRVTKIRSQLKTFLSEATGFYHDFMLKIRAKYGLPLGYLCDGSDDQIPLAKDGIKSSEVKKGLHSCHRCLIYLGDLARYKGLYGEGDSKVREFEAAASYYIQASLFWSSSGNPHHQLAILAGYSNDEMLSIYRYFRSLAVDSPFITARDNLITAFEKNRQNHGLLAGDAKLSAVKPAPPSRMTGRGRAKADLRSCVKPSSVGERASELYKAFITRFIRLNGILFTRTSLETFAEVFSVVKHDLLELLSSGLAEKITFGSDALECRVSVVRMIAILIFSVHNVKKESENQSYADILQRSVLVQNAFSATFEFMGCILGRCSQLNDPSSSYLLPGIMVFVEWLACHEDVAMGSELDEKQIKARSLFWNNLISLMNKLMLLSSGETCLSNMSKYDEREMINRLALPEDIELRGFLPLVPAHRILDFSRTHSFGGDECGKEKITARVQRILAAGKYLANTARVGIYLDSKLKKFMVGVEPDDNLAASVMCEDFKQKAEVVESEDDEDEVIVFKPNEMLQMSSNVIAAVGGHDSLLFQDAGMQPPTANGIAPSISSWLTDHVPKLEPIKSGVSQPPYPHQFVTGIIPQTAAAVLSTTFAKPSPSMQQPGLKKNPVSRPVRHIGPPPGFGCAPPKIVVDEPLNNISHLIPPQIVDNYSSSWLDGYHLPPLNHQSNHVGVPFPGSEYHFQEQMKQGQLVNGNQQSSSQQQSFWEGRFIV